MAAGSTDHRGRCTKQFVPIVERKPKCRSNQQKEDLFTAGTALTSAGTDIEIILNHSNAYRKESLSMGPSAPPIFFTRILNKQKFITRNKGS
jgi:hypothetical protein